MPDVALLAVPPAHLGNSLHIQHPHLRSLEDRAATPQLWNDGSPDFFTGSAARNVLGASIETALDHRAQAADCDHVRCAAAERRVSR